MNSSNFYTWNNNLVLFQWYDYLIFICMALGSVSIGIYFGCFGTKQATVKEYLLGNKNMAVFPTVMSLMACHLSGIALLGMPLDVYLYGAFFMISAVAYVLVAIITTFVYLPVYHTLQITSIYEYLEMRFDERTRKLASLLFTIKIFCFQPISFFVATLALSTATNISVNVIVTVFFGVCIFYTTIGGFKTVIWTDTLQFVIIFSGYFAIAVFGIYNQNGGFSKAIQIAKDGGRLDIFVMDLSLSKRDTFWSSFVGYSSALLTYSSVSQNIIQKILSVPTLKKSKITSACFYFGVFLFTLLSVILGILIYAKYEKCDPFTARKLNTADQLLPYFAMDTTSHVPGLSGIFISGIFCTALSCLSSNLNCLSCTIYEDFLKKYLDRKNFRRRGIILRVLVVLTGLTIYLLVFVAAQFKILYAMSLSIVGCSIGPLCGLFTLGILFPKAKSRGAFYGCIIAFLFVGIISIGSSYYKLMNLLIYPTKPLSVENCELLQNSTGNNFITNSSGLSDVSIFFKISHNWIAFIGVSVTIIVGLIISYLDPSKTDPVRRELLSPVIYSLLSAEGKGNENGDIEELQGLNSGE